MNIAFSAVIVLALLAGPVLSTPTRKLLQTEDIVLSGTAIVIAEDYLDKRANKFLAIHTSSGERLRVELDDPTVLSDLTTGQPIEVVGKRMRLVGGSIGSDSSSTGNLQGLVSSDGRAVKGFRASSLRKAASQETHPFVREVTVDAQSASTSTSTGTVSTGDVTTAAAGDIVTAAVITLSTNQLVRPDASAIFIPVATLNPVTGGNCPGIGSPLLTSTDLRNYVVFQENNPDGITVGSTFNECSFNKTVLTLANSRVANLVRLPCTGVTDGVSWNVSLCDFTNMNAWSEAVDRVITSRGTLLSNYNSRVYLLSPGMCNDMVGLGYVGCNGNIECRAWIGGDFWDKPQAMVHEISHNLYMAHATATYTDGTYDEYGDATCTMGACCEPRCYNTPHAWQAGWITVQQLNGTNLRAGQTTNVFLASQSNNTRSGVRIVPTWSTAEPLFLGYRTQVGGDEQLAAYLANRVHIHTSRISNTFDSYTTSLKAFLSTAGSAYVYSPAGLVLRHKGFSKGSAVVSVCRRGGAETAATCADGIDYDCNGLAGSADPACSKFK